MSNIWCKALGVSCVLFAVVVVACEPEPSESFERRITVERLTGATLVEVSRDKSIVWHFGVKRFLLEIRGARRDALVRQLLGRAANVSQIRGHWQFDEKNHQLVLHDVMAENLKDSHKVMMPMFPAGPFRTDLGDRQYNIDELDICGGWESVGEGPKVSWTFEVSSGNSLVVQCAEGTLPAVLTTKLFGHRAEVSKIEGDWEFKRSRRLVLTNLRAGAHRQTEPVETTIKPVDVLTIELLDTQCRRVKWLRASAFNPDTIRVVSVKQEDATGARLASGNGGFPWQAGQRYPALKRVRNPRNGHDYQLIDVAMSWHDAKALCESLDGYLATATSKEENDFIYQHFGKDHVCWLGATDEETEGTWQWVTGEPFEYKNWLGREPNNKEEIEHYLNLGNTDSVYDRGQSYFFRFGSSWNDHAAHGLYHRVPIVFPVCEWDSPGDSDRLRPLPENGEPRELLSFLEEMKAFRPDTSAESKVFLWTMPKSLKAAAQRILQVEKDKSSHACMVALYIMLEHRIGSLGYSAPHTHRQTLDLVKTLLRAKLETKLDPDDVELAVWAAQVFEHNADASLAQEAYGGYAELIAKSNNQEFFKTAEQMKDAVRRLEQASKARDNPQP